MRKGIPNKRYTGEFKQEVVETMHREKLSHVEVARLYGITAHDRVVSWERIYLEEGPEGLYIFKAELINYLDYYNNRRIKLKLKGLTPAQHRSQTLQAA